MEYKIFFVFLLTIVNNIVWKKIVSGFSKTTCTIPINPYAKTICWNVDQSESQISPQKGNKIIDLSIGQGHLCQIDISNSVECIGDNTFGQATPLTIISSLSSVKTSYSKIVTGYRHSCALTQTKLKIDCWGDDLYGQTSVQQLVMHDEVENLNAGPYSTCQFSSSKILICIGLGQIVRPFSDNKINLDISQGINNTICILKQHLILLNTIECFGVCDNNMCDIPLEQNYGSTLVSTGFNHVCRLSSQINLKPVEVACWGNNNYGQSSIPQLYKNYIFSVTTGHQFTCIVRFNGHTYCIGMANNQVSPNAIQFTSSLAVGNIQKCVVKNGQPKCFKHNKYQQSIEIENKNYETLDISVGQNFACQIQMNKNFTCTGQQNQVIDGATKHKESVINQMSVSVDAICIINMHTNIPTCWGTSRYNHLEISKIQSKMIEVGYSHTCLVPIDSYVSNALNKIYCQGNNTQDQLEVNSGNMNVHSMKLGLTHSCASMFQINKPLTSFVKCWGSNSHGQTNNPTIGKGKALNVTAAANYSCAILIDGYSFLLCWGDVNQEMGFKMTMNLEKVQSGKTQICVINFDGEQECQSPEKKMLEGS